MSNLKTINKSARWETPHHEATTGPPTTASQPNITSAATTTFCHHDTPLSKTTKPPQLRSHHRHPPPRNHHNFEATIAVQPPPSPKPTPTTTETHHHRSHLSFLSLSLFSSHRITFGTPPPHLHHHIRNHNHHPTPSPSTIATSTEPSSFVSLSSVAETLTATVILSLCHHLRSNHQLPSASILSSLSSTGDTFDTAGVVAVSPCSLTTTHPLPASHRGFHNHRRVCLLCFFPVLEHTFSPGHELMRRLTTHNPTLLRTSPNMVFPLASVCIQVCTDETASVWMKTYIRGTMASIRTSGEQYPRGRSRVSLDIHTMSVPTVSQNIHQYHYPLHISHYFIIR
ncbi:hypothetical protein PIB30_029863 [Stylosanthes scabra]|uniref:Uncharacterized protein n=1 Tax=Stylosanthes scabra TaxID=79078 RepID=A0ABU6Y8M3_9FABA|nr:hypothetical protein [Stylosanthes scabra]